MEGFILAYVIAENIIIKGAGFKVIEDNRIHQYGVSIFSNTKYSFLSDTEMDMVMKGVVRVTNLHDATEHIGEVFQRVKKENLLRTYKIKRMERGKIPFFIPPPKQDDASVEIEKDSLPDKDDVVVTNDKLSTKRMMQTWGAKVHPSPLNLTELGQKIFKIDPLSSGSLGITFFEAVEMASLYEDIKCCLGSVLDQYNGGGIEDKYFARMGTNVIFVYKRETFSLIDKKDIKVKKAMDLCWSPTDPIFALYVPELNGRNQPAREPKGHRFVIIHGDNPWPDVDCFCRQNNHLIVVVPHLLVHMVCKDFNDHGCRDP
nr:eukaryotic translation initiation factor 3 subunit B-like [Tanacetum cinerariifolium]